MMLERGIFLTGDSEVVQEVWAAICNQIRRCPQQRDKWHQG